MKKFELKSEIYDEFEIIEWAEERLDEEKIRGEKFDKALKNFKKSIKNLEDGERINVLGNIIEAYSEHDDFEDIYEEEEFYIW